MANNSKQYGLIMPQKANQGLIRPRPSIFNESSGSEEEGGGATDWVKKALKREAEKPFQKKQHQVDMEKALAEDSTVYQYDEVYDQIEEKKAEMITAKKQDKKPRYIQSLMMQAEKRKREQERRNERTIQKEREAEGDKFKDKESFVTSAYRAKLEEFRQQEEEERRMDTLEAIADVTKQKDLGGFYRHLYHQTISGGTDEVKNKEDKDSENPEKEKEKESGQHSESKGDKEHETGIQVKTEKINAENVESSPQNSSKSREDNPDKKHSRHYRRRNDSSASSDSDSKHSGENLDADSDFSVDSDSSDSDSKSGSNSEKENGQKKKQQKVKRKNDEQQDTDKNETSIAGDKTEKTQVQKHNQDGNPENPTKKIKVEKESENNVTVPVENIVSEKKVAKVKTNIWIKRTVGDVFESALQRYYERKANKLANRG